tara:strand:+ start:777 stop:1367 length:591 start_codon:yes stop_codon:yes gene_type:complete
MACDIAKGRKEPCKDVVGGIKNLYFVNYGDLGTVTVTDDATGEEITNITGYTGDVAGNLTCFKYEVKGNSSLEQTVNASRENGTVFYEQTLNLTLKKLSKLDNKELKLLAYGRPHVAVEDYNGNFMMVGLEHGADVSGGTVVTGAAMGDLSGYTLTLTAMETKPAVFMANTGGAVFNSTDFAGLSGTITITTGTNS